MNSFKKKFKSPDSSFSDNSVLNLMKGLQK